jgi:hypothetical protein
MRYFDDGKKLINVVFFLVFGCLYYTSSNSRQVAEFKQNHPLLVMLASLTAGYYLILQVQYLSEYIC